MIYEIVLTQSYFGQRAINRWNYLSSGVAVGITGSAALLTALGFLDTAGTLPADKLGVSIQNIQAGNVLFENVLAKAIREAPTDFYDYAYPTGLHGLNTAGEGMSPINAFGFKTNRVRTDIARGTKRFVGVPENSSEEGGDLTSAAAALAAIISTRMSETVTYSDGGSSLSFAPIVVQKEEYETPVSHKRAYKYYDTIAEQLEHIAEGVVWNAYDQVRSQVSRQYGHGG